MKKLLLCFMLLLISIPAFAKDPKETVEYWQKNLNSKTINAEIDAEMKKCWHKSRIYFKVPVGSKQWNICCAIRAAVIGTTFEEQHKFMKNRKEKYSE